MRAPLLFQILGLTLIASSCTLLLKCEGRYQQALVHRVPPHIFEAPRNHLDPALEGKVVHLTAPARCVVEIQDDELGVSDPGLKLSRSVEECYQRNPARRDWRYLRDNQSGIHSKKFYPAQALIGPFSLPGEQLGECLSGPMQSVRPVAKKIPPEARWKGRTLYLQGRPEDPQPGDRKVNYHRFPSTEVSVVGKQSQDRLLPPPGHRQVWIRAGKQSADDYLEPLRNNTPAPWSERLQAAFQLLLGLALLGSPWIARKLHRPVQEDPI